MMNKQKQQQLMNMNQSLMSMNQMNPRPPQQHQVTKSTHNKPFTQRPPISQSSNLIDFRRQTVQMNPSYGMWGQPQQFPNLNLNPVAMKPQSSATFNKSLGPTSNWKGKRVNKPNDKRRAEQLKPFINSGGIGDVNVNTGGGSGGNLNFNNYNPPTLNELQHQNRLKTRKYFPKKKFKKNYSINMNMSGSTGRSAPYAPRNTTSFIIRAKKSGGIAPLVSPYPVTPAVLPTPILSPSGEVLGDMAKEEWGVDGYGSMKGLIRLRSPGHGVEINEDEEEDEDGSSESDVEEHVEVERRLDHDLSRFEMICDPNSVSVGGMEYHNVLENRVDDQDTHIAQLEEENLFLKERLFLMERELGDLRRRLLFLERRGNRGEDVNEEFVENESENESESRGEGAHSVGDNSEDCDGENIEEDRSKGKGNDGHIADDFEAAETTERTVQLHEEGKFENEYEGKGINKTDRTINITYTERKDKTINEPDESNEANKPEEKIGEMVEDDNDENEYVDVEAVTKDNVDAGSPKHVVEVDICASGCELAKDNMVL